MRSPLLTPGLSAFARADISRFGLTRAQDLSGKAQAGQGLALEANIQLDISWRTFEQSSDNRDKRETAFPSQQTEVELGLNVFFWRPPPSGGHLRPRWMRRRKCRLQPKAAAAPKSGRGAGTPLTTTLSRRAP